MGASLAGVAILSKGAILRRVPSFGGAILSEDARKGGFHKGGSVKEGVVKGGAMKLGCHEETPVSQKASGSHPTGMHSCLTCFMYQIKINHTKHYDLIFNVECI